MTGTFATTTPTAPPGRSRRAVARRTGGATTVRASSSGRDPATPRRVRAIACALLVVVAAYCRHCSSCPPGQLHGHRREGLRVNDGVARTQRDGHELPGRASGGRPHTSLHVERFVGIGSPSTSRASPTPSRRSSPPSSRGSCPACCGPRPSRARSTRSSGPSMRSLVQLITAGPASPRRSPWPHLAGPALSLAPVIRDFHRLGIRYLDPLRRLEGREVTVTLASPAAFARWRWYFATAINDQLALILGFVGAALGAVAVATRRRRAIGALLVGVAVANLLALLLLAIGDQYTAGAATGSAVAHAIISTLTADLRVELGVVVAVAGVLALAVWLSGPAPSAVMARGRVTTAIADLTRRREARTTPTPGSGPTSSRSGTSPTRSAEPKGRRAVALGSAGRRGRPARGAEPVNLASRGAAGRAGRRTRLPRAARRAEPVERRRGAPAGGARRSDGVRGHFSRDRRATRDAEPVGSAHRRPAPRAGEAGPHRRGTGRSRTRCRTCLPGGTGRCTLGTAPVPVLQRVRAAPAPAVVRVGSTAPARRRPRARRPLPVARAAPRVPCGSAHGAGSIARVRPSRASPRDG